MVGDARALAWMTAWQCLDSIREAHAKYGQDPEAVDLDGFTQRTQRTAEIYAQLANVPADVGIGAAEYMAKQIENERRVEAVRADLAEKLSGHRKRPEAAE